MNKKALSVTALTKYIKYKFDQDKHLKDILLEGEISNFKHNIRGHFYFTLKDKNASISAIMFKGNAWKVKFQPEDGMNVLVRGYVSVFEASGQYQIYVDSMEQVGLGNLYQAYLQLKETLEKEGLFKTEYKKPIPKYPKQIAVLTSKTGAAVRDIIHIINRRYPLATILIYPTTVQGDNAKYELVENLKKADANNANDVIIVGRGGGSIEDLWAFNEDIVARQIFATKTPVISAVGHETDFTISDFVADMRAPTPSGAAEIAVPDQMTLHRDINAIKNRLYDALNRTKIQKHRQLTNLTDRYIFKDPTRIILPKEKQLDNMYNTLRLLHPKKRVSDSQDKLKHLVALLNKTYRQSLKQKESDYNQMLEHLDYVNPLHIMKKGYTLTKKDGNIIKSITQINTNDTITVQFHDGALSATVNKKEKDDSNE
ncbi:MAG: exodeoxyribonuclease VII large subunit [Bacillota bacterium]